MEYVEGPDLGKLMASAKERGTRIPAWISAWIIAEAAKGLHYAHERKDEGGGPLEIVHRDVSPQNVLLSFDGSVKIADFGIASAKLFVEEQGVLKGKFGYMSPEQARGERVDRRSDLYALGVILWEALTGKPLHGGLGGEALLDIVRSGQLEPPSIARGGHPRARGHRHVCEPPRRRGSFLRPGARPGGRHRRRSPRRASVRRRGYARSKPADRPAHRARSRAARREPDIARAPSIASDSLSQANAANRDAGRRPDGAQHPRDSAADLGISRAAATLPPVVVEVSSEHRLGR